MFVYFPEYGLMFQDDSDPAIYCIVWAIIVS